MIAASILCLKIKSHEWAVTSNADHIRCMYRVHDETHFAPSETRTDDVGSALLLFLIHVVT